MKNLAKLRKDRGLTQTRLAKLLGVSTSTVAMWETGQRKPDYHTIARLCEFFAVSFEDMAGIVKPLSGEEEGRVPVLGSVRAGMPRLARQEVIGYEYIDPKLAADGKIFALKIKGDSMEPKMSRGDVVLVRRQSEAENGRIAVVLVGREEATVKKLSFQKEGVTLIPTNPDYMPIYYTAAECRNLPVTIVGVVIELRSRF